MDYWLNDPSVLWRAPYAYEWMADVDAPLTRRLNAVARLTLITALLLFVYQSLFKNINKTEALAFTLKFVAAGLALNVLVFAYYRLSPTRHLNESKTFKSLYQDAVEDWEHSRPASIPPPSKPYNLIDVTDSHAGRDGPENPGGFRHQHQPYQATELFTGAGAAPSTTSMAPRLGAGMPSETQKVVQPMDAIAKSANTLQKEYGLHSPVPAHIRNALNARAGTDFAKSLLKNSMMDDSKRRLSGAYQASL